MPADAARRRLIEPREGKAHGSTPGNRQHIEASNHRELAARRLATKRRDVPGIPTGEAGCGPSFLESADHSNTMPASSNSPEA
jgi:hypothetical protein